MQKTSKRIVSMLLAISMLFGIFPITVFAEEVDTRDVISEIYGTIADDKTIDDFTPIYGENVTSSSNKPTITEDSSDHPAYFYNNGSEWQRYNGSSWERASDFDSTFKSGTYRFRIKVYVDNDDANPEGCKTGANTHKLDTDGGFKAYINEEEWDTEVDSVSDAPGATSSIYCYSKEFTVEEPTGLPLTFPNDNSYGINWGRVGESISSIDVSTKTEGGTKPYTYSKKSGPSWINVSEEGVLSGTRNAISDATTLVVLCQDSAENEEEIEIPVGAIYVPADSREVISEVNGTIADSKTIDDFAPVYGEDATSSSNRPIITEDSESHPAYFYNTGAKWQKLNGSSFSDVESGTFEEGTYRFRIKIYVDNDNSNPEGCQTGGGTHVLDSSENFHAYVNGEEWTRDEVSWDSRSSSVNLYSKTFTVVEEEPAVAGTIIAPTFDNLEVDYTDQAYKAVTINLTNTGNVDGSKLQATLSGTNADSFELDTHFGGVMVAPNTWNNVLYVRPIVGLSSGTYSATITLKYDADGDGTYETTIGSAEISVTVAGAAPEEELITVANCTFTKPVAGAHPDMEPIADNDKFTVTFSNVYLDESPYPNLTSEDVFEAGKSYTYRIEFHSKEGYRFSDTEPATVFTFNGETTSSYGGDVSNFRQATYDVSETSPETYTVTIDPNNGEDTQNISGLEIGTNNCQISSPTSYGFTIPNGYEFAGWKIGDVIYNAGETFDVTGNMTAVAQWTPIEYHITYNLGDGIVPGSNPTVYTVESSNITLINPAKTNYYFAGWTGTGLSEVTKNVTIPTGSVGDREYTAQWVETTKITQIVLNGEYVAPVVGATIPTITSSILSVNGDESLKNIIDIDYIKWQKRTGEGDWDFVDATGTFEADTSYRLRMLFYVADESQSSYAFPNTSVTVTLTGTTLTKWQQGATSLGVWTEDVTPSSSAPITSISVSPTSIDFGNVETGFSSSDHIQVVTITNNGTNPIYLNNVNPTDDGPFGSYGYDTSAVINPGQDLEVQLVVNDSSHLAGTAGTYEGNYVFTATNSNDSTDIFTLTVPATVTIVVPTTITEVSVSNVDLPEVGESYEDTTNSPSSMTYSGAYQMCGMGFYVQNGTEWENYNTSEDIVEAGKTYKITIDLMVTGTNKFDSSITDDDITINGEPGKFAAFYNSNSIISIYKEFTTEAPSTTHSARFSAVDIANGEELEGTHIQLLDSEDAVVQEWYSTKEVKEITGLSSGIEYTLKTTVAPDGYTLATDITFTIDDEGRITSTGTVTESGTMLVEFAKTQVKVLAVKDSDNSSLAGATIQVLDSDGNVRVEWSSTTENHIIEGLIAGKEYTIKITEVPTGYEIPENITFTIATDGKVTSTGDMTNDGVLLVSISEVVTPTTYTVVYDVNGGTVHGGELTTRTVASGDTFTITKLFQLPDEDYHITVHPPKDKWFDAFEISGERYERGAKITITGNTVIKYLWKDITYVDKVELTIEPPVAGTKIEGEFNEILGHIDYESITVRPIVTFPEDADYIVYSDEIYWTVSGESTPYLGEIEAGKTYNAVVYVYCEDESYQFLEEGLEVVVNGEKITTFDSQGFWVTVEYPMESVSQYLLKANVGEGVGNISVVPSGDEPDFEYPTTSVAYKENAGTKWLLAAKPNEDYRFVNWTKSGDDSFSDTNSQITIELTEDVEYLANFELIEYNVTYDANGGTGTMSGENSKYYIFPSCDFTAPTGKTFDKWEVNGKTYKVGDTLTLTEDITVKATWKNKSTSSGGGGGSSSSSYKITTKIENGTITPANTSVKKNADQEFAFKANDGYEITDVLVDGKSVGVVDSYKLEKVTAKHTIEVKTAKVSALSSVDDWAKEEMAKAEEKGLIPETFASIDATKPITRLEFAAVAVKLYEAISGKKAEPVAVNPFTDTNDEYVLKAYALGITLGTSETTFTPNAEITREQMATMLTRALNKAGINTEYDITNATKFADDSNLNDWGRPSVYFMAKEEIIKGVGDNRFNGLGNAKVEEAIAITLRSVEIFGK